MARVSLIVRGSNRHVQVALLGKEACVSSLSVRSRSCAAVVNICGGNWGTGGGPAPSGGASRMLRFSMVGQCCGFQKSDLIARNGAAPSCQRPS